MLLLGQPFINANTITKFPTYSNLHYKSYPLLSLGDSCREPPTMAIDVLEKAILLLRSHADITHVDGRGDNVLHCVLKAVRNDHLRGREMQVEALMAAACDCDRCNASFREPKQLLKVAIAAGANIYGINEDGYTPTMVAEMWDLEEERDRDKEWFEALEECGINVEEVLHHTGAWESMLSELEDEYSDCSSEVKAKIVEDFNSSFWDSGHIRQKSSLSFEEFCDQRDKRRKLLPDCRYNV